MQISAQSDPGGRKSIYMFLVLFVFFAINNPPKIKENQQKRLQHFSFKFWQIFYVGTPSQEKWGRDRKEDDTGESNNYVQAYFYTYITDRENDRIIWDIHNSI